MRQHGYKRGRLGGVLLAVALGAVAMLALPAIGVGKRGHDGHGPRPAGTISSFDPETHMLTVDLAKGGEISALVVRRTHIRCGEDGRRHRRRGHRRGRGGDDASASRRADADEGRSAPSESDGGDAVGDGRGVRGQDEPGDDRGGRGLEPGEDNHAQGEHHRGRGHDHGRHGCNAGDLVEGATVIRAEIVLTHGKAIFKKIGLLPPQAVAPEPEPEPEEPETL